MKFWTRLFLTIISVLPLDVKVYLNSCNRYMMSFVFAQFWSNCGLCVDVTGEEEISLMFG